MSLKKYIAESTKEYKYRLRTAFPLTDDHMDHIERVLLKYMPVDITRPKKMMFQARPLDFPNVSNVEVHFVDLTTNMPVSPYMLESEIRVALAVPVPMLIVRSFNDPNEIQQNDLDAQEAICIAAEKDGMEPSALMNDSAYSEYDENTNPLFGDEYNKKFKDYLRTVQKEHTTEVDAPNPLFKWMDMPKGTPDDNMAFNADIKDAPGLGKAGTHEAPVETAPEGNFDNTEKRYKRLYGKNGTRVALTRTSDEVRKGGN